MNKKTQNWLGKPGDLANLVMLDLDYLPYQLLYDGKPVSAIRCHRLIASDLKQRLLNVWAAARLEVKKIHGYNLTTAAYDSLTLELISDNNLNVYAGCYNYRPQRGSSKISSHSWGAAIDFNPADNAIGTWGHMPRWFVSVWKQKIGSIRWVWGGSWLKIRKDPMHFEVDYLGRS